jgi:GTP-binding protein
VLWHVLDIAPVDPEADPVRDARAIVAELKKFSKDLAAKPRWLVLNKADLMPSDEAQKLAKDIVRRLRHKGPWFLVSAVSGQGTRQLAEQVMDLIEAATESAADAAQSDTGDLDARAQR